MQFSSGGRHYALDSDTITITAVITAEKTRYYCGTAAMGHSVNISSLIIT